MTPFKKKEGYIEVPHRADVAMKVWSGELAGLFVQAAHGLYSLMGAKKSWVGNFSRSMRLNETDYETLLIRFLNELILDVQLQSAVYKDLDIHIQQHSLYGELKGEKSSAFLREIKAATFHECRILQTKAGFETMIVFDI